MHRCPQKVCFRPFWHRGFYKITYRWRDCLLRMIAAALLLAASAQGALVTAPKYGARAVQPRMYAAFAKEPVAALGPDGQPSFVQTEMRGACPGSAL